MQQLASSLIVGLTTTLKDRRKLFALLIISFAWTVLSVLPILGFTALPVQLLGFLTFAQGGVGSGLLGNIGGVVGKAIWASFFMPLINGRKPWLGVSSGLQMLHVGLRGLNQTGMINLLTGGGIALLTYNFLTGNASPKNGMIGLVMFMISSKAAYMKSSILYKAASTLGETTAGPMSDTNTSAKRILAGAAVGSLLAILLSFSRISVICYLAGLLMLVAAIIIGINQRRGVTVT